MANTQTWQNSWTPPHKRISRLHQLLRDHRKLRYSAIALGVALLGAIGSFVVVMNRPHSNASTTQTPAPAKAQAVAPTPEPQKFYSAITGVQVADKAAQTTPVTAIMIENSPDARPQSGLKQAGVVFEAIAEGGITRFMAIYQQDKPTLIGPVRSVRPYYIDWVTPFDASIAHVGGSANALKTVRSGAYRDIDQFFNGASYWRSTDRYAPHNVYTNFERLDALNASKGYTTSNPVAFDRLTPTLSADKKPVGAAATRIDVSISSATYNSHYDYDASTGLYNRSEGGKPHVDREQGQLAPKVVVVMKVPTVVALEDGYREQMMTVGSGEVSVFQDGQVYTGTWNKADTKSQLVFKNATGAKIELEPGQTWITAIPTEQKVTWQ